MIIPSEYPSYETVLARLEKLANSDFEEIKRISNRKKFDFSNINGTDNRALDSLGCGTVGCLMGEIPIIFHDDFFFSHNGDVISKHRPFTGGGIQEFFALRNDQKNHLFYPRSQQPELFGGEYLETTATREQVIANLKIFIEKVKLGEIMLQIH
jgi:hypothetical protein